MPDIPRIGSLRTHRAYVIKQAAQATVEDLMAVVARHESGRKSYLALNSNDGGHGISFGRFQFNQERGLLGSLFARMYEAEPQLFVQLTYGDTAKNRDPDALARQLISELQTNGKRLTGPLTAQLGGSLWRKRLERLGSEPRFQRLQDELALEAYFREAQKIALEFELRSERAFVLLFDMCIQHGPDGTRRHVSRAFAANPQNAREMRQAGEEQRPAEEHDMLVLIAQQSASAAGESYLKALVDRRERILRNKKITDAPTSLITSVINLPPPAII